MPGVTPLFDSTMVFDAAAIVASPENAGILPTAKVPVAEALPKSKLETVAKPPRPRLVLA